MDLSRLLQEEMRRGATPQEIQELSNYIRSDKFNHSQFSHFLGNSSAPPAIAKTHPATPLQTPVYNPTPIPAPAPTQAPAPESSTPVKGKAKRKRAKKDEGGEGSSKKQAPEKRGAVFRKAPSKAIKERAERVKTQRMFLISRGGRTEVPTTSSLKSEQALPAAPTTTTAAAAAGDSTQPSGEPQQQVLSESFEVLGSTGNCYTVTICQKPSCTCPDFGKGNICKHLVFVYLRVLRIPEELPFWYQKALITTELEVLFENAVEDPTTRVSASVRKAWEAKTGRTNSGKSDGFYDGVTESEEGKKRIPVEGDNCPVCFDAFAPGVVQGLEFCLNSCGNALHAQCFKSYAASRRTQGLPVTCVFCRQPWGGSADDSAIGINSEGYMNLGAAAGMSTTRDTSTYYHGPRAGERYYGNQEARYNPSGMGRGWGGY